MLNTNNLSIAEVELQFSKELRRQVNRYFTDNAISKKGNAGLLLKTVILFALYIVPFMVLLVVDVPIILVFLLLIVMGIGMAGVGMNVVHDASHGAFSRKRWVNKLMGNSIHLLGSSLTNWNIQHNIIHHTYTNIKGQDDDIDAKGPVRLSNGSRLKGYHKHQYLYAFLFYGLMTTAKLVNDFQRLYHYGSRKLYRGPSLSTAMIKMLFIKLLYLVIFLGLPLSVTSFRTGQVIFGFFLMHFVSALILSVVFQLAHVTEDADQLENQDTVPLHWHIHQLRTTVNFAPKNSLLNWYLGGLNYQIEHHLFPSISHIHYKNLAPLVRESAKKFSIVYNTKPRFRDALYSHVSRLKQLGRA